MSDSYSTTPTGGGQSPSAPTNSKYIFDPNRCIVFDAEVYPGRWCVGFLFPGREKSLCVDGDRAQLAEILDKIHKADRTLVGYNSAGYDLPVLRAVLAGLDPYPVSQACVAHTGRGLPPELRDIAHCWPTIRANHIDLCERTRDSGRFPSLKRVAANLGCKNLQELPFEPNQELTDAEWAEVKRYNKKDLHDTQDLLDYFSPELQAIAALSNRYGCDLRNTHQAGIAAKILCDAYRHQYGCKPVQASPPPSVRYTPPSPVRRPQNPIAAAWFDRVTTEAFPLVVPKGGEYPKPVVPEPSAPIEIGGAKLNVGSGGTHSADRPALYRTTDASVVYETDVASFYPALMARYGFFPRALWDVGLEEYREILTERLAIKEQATAATDPAEAKRLKVQADGLKIVLNSTFGQFGNPYRSNPLYDPEALLAVTLS